MKKSLLRVYLLLLTAGCLVTVQAAPKPAKVLDLWPGVAPGEKGDIPPEVLRPPKPNDKKKVDRIANVSKPILSFFPASKAGNTGSAVVVCPGGGYNILAYDLEGTEVCEWLNSIGVNAILLKYRVPRRKGRPKHEAPLQEEKKSRERTPSPEPRRLGPPSPDPPAN